MPRLHSLSHKPISKNKETKLALFDLEHLSPTALSLEGLFRKIFLLLIKIILHSLI